MTLRFKRLAVVFAALVLPLTAVAQTTQSVQPTEHPFVVLPLVAAPDPVAKVPLIAVPQITLAVPNADMPTTASSATAPADPALVAPGPAPLIRLGGNADPAAVVVNMSVPLGTVAAAKAAPATGVAVTAAPAKPTTWMMPLVVSTHTAPRGVRVGAGMPQPGILRLTGEVADAELRVALPQGVSPMAPLVLALRSSVNNLPENSALVVTVNGVARAPMVLEAMGNFAPRVIELAGLQPGVNVIHLAARQSHRIFCGPEASFGIWTELDLSQSGVPVDPSLVPLAGEGMLAALRVQSAGDGVIEILVEDDTDDRLVRAVTQRLANALGRAPRVRTLPFYSNKMDPDAKARVAIVRSLAPKATLRRGAGAAMVLQIEHVGIDLPDLSVVLPQEEIVPDFVALTPGEVTPLSLLGTGDIIANTHYHRRDVNFLLPDDWLLLASQKAEFMLNYGFADGLAAGGLLLVKINGETIRLLPLDKEGGKFQPPLRIRFPSNQLDPGVNTLTFEMSVPGDPGTLPCLPRASDMLVILGNSTLTVPPAPKMRQIDIQASLAVMDGRDVILPLPAGADASRAREMALDFAANLTPLMASARRPVVHVVGVDGIGLVPTGNTEVNRRDLQAAVDLRALAVLDKLARTPLDAVIAPALDPVMPELRFNLGGDAPRVDGTAAVPVADGMVTARFNRIVGWLSRQTETVHAAAFPGSVPLAEWLVGKTGQALMLQLDPMRPNDVWVVAGTEIAPLDLATSLDAFRRDASHTGQTQAALLRADGTWDTWSQNPQPLLYEALTFGNLRVVMGNNASWSPVLFMSLSLFMALISVIPAILFVLITRRAGSRI
jgi:hypothetical protein